MSLRKPIADNRTEKRKYKKWMKRDWNENKWKGTEMKINENEL